MSTSITKQGILLADGVEVGENIIVNGLPLESEGGWNNTSTWEYTDKDGFPCIHFTGALKTTKYAAPLKTTGNYKILPENGDSYTFSADVLFEDVVRGTTNYFVSLYMSGVTIDGTWRAATPTTNSGNFTSATGNVLDETKLNGNGWTRVWYRCTYGDYAWIAHNPMLYARDFTGDVYFKNVKLEKSLTPTPWTPAPSDDIYVGDHGFFEGSDKGSIGKGYMEGNEFYEY